MHIYTRIYIFTYIYMAAARQAVEALGLTLTRHSMRIHTYIYVCTLIYVYI